MEHSLPSQGLPRQLVWLQARPSFPHSESLEEQLQLVPPVQIIAFVSEANQVIQERVILQEQQPVLVLGHLYQPPSYLMSSRWLAQRNLEHHLQEQLDSGQRLKQLGLGGQWQYLQEVTNLRVTLVQLELIHPWQQVMLTSLSVTLQSCFRQELRQLAPVPQGWSVM